MAEKRLNKNLVGALTVAGMLLAVSVVAVATMNVARKDPKLLASRAAEYEKRGDLKNAIDQFRRAFNVDKEATYLVDAARCAYSLGELRDAIGLLNLAQAQAPDNPDVLNALLERYWELRKAGLEQWDVVLKQADALLKQQPENLLALASKSEALSATVHKDPANKVLADEAIAKALAINPADRRVAILHGMRVLNEGMTAAREINARGKKDDAQQALNKTRLAAMAVLKPAADAHPTDADVVTTYAQLLVDNDQRDESRALLERAVAGAPTDPDLHYSLAKYSQFEAERLKQENAAPEAVGAAIAAGLASVAKAIELDPTLYRAYGTRAQLNRAAWEQSGRWEKEKLVCQKELLESFISGLRDSLGIKSVRAVLAERDRPRAVVEAFDLAVAFFNSAADAPERTQALEYAKRFYTDAKTQFPESFMVPLMEGHVAVLEGDAQAGIKAFRTADEKLASIGGMFSRMAKEQLARLYLDAQETGLSMKYTDAALQLYIEQGQTPPKWLFLNKAQLLISLDKAQQALDLLDATKPQWGTEPDWLAVHARALSLLGRSEEAKKNLAIAAKGDTRFKMEQARVLASSKDYAGAEAILRDVLTEEPANIGALRLIAQVMMTAGRAKEAAAFMGELSGKVRAEKPKSVINAFRVLLQTENKDEREAELLKIIESVADPEQRALEFVNYWMTRGKFEEAATHADQLEKIKGSNDVETCTLQLQLALQLKQLEKAEKYANKLGELNADRVGGARYRGQVLAHKGELDKAMAEYRIAERELPTDSGLKVQIAQALLSYSPPRYEDAMAALTLALEFDPRDFFANKLLYSVYEDMNRKMEGIKYLEMAAKVNPRDEYIVERQKLLEEEKDPKKGIAWREPKRQEDPFDVENILRLAELYHRVDDFPKADECLQKALELEPDNRAIGHIAAGIYAERKMLTEGEAFLRKHVELREGSSKVGALLLLCRFFDRVEAFDKGSEVVAQAETLVDQVTDVDDKRKARLKLAAAFEAAEHLSRAGKIEELPQAYRKALQLVDADPGTDQQIRLNILRSLLTLRKQDEFGKEMAEFVKAYPNDTRAMRLQAELLMMENKADAARDILTRVLSTEPGDAWSLFMRGRIAIEQQRFNDAKEDLLKAKAAAPKAFRYGHRVELARVYEYLEQMNLAEAEMREIFKDSNGDQGVALQILRMLINSNQLPKAQEFVNEQMSKDPKVAFWPYQLGRILLEQKEYSAAVSSLKKAVDLTEGSNPSVLADYLTAMINANRAKEAAQAFEALKAELRTPQVMAIAGEAFLKGNQKPKAIELYGQAMLNGSQRSPDELGFAVTQAVTHLGFDEGMAVVKQAIAIAKKNENANSVTQLEVSLARAFAQSEDVSKLQEARNLVDTLLATLPPESPLRLECMLITARLEEAYKDYEKAAKSYELILEKAPNSAAVLNNLAYLLADRLNRPKDAVPYAERARSVAGLNANVFDTLGWVYFLNGDTQKAETALQESLRLQPTNAAANYHLGRLYAAAGRKAEAQRAFERCIESARKERAAEYEKKADEALRGLK